MGWEREILRRRGRERGEREACGWKFEEEREREKEREKLLEKKKKEDANGGRGKIGWIFSKILIFL